MVNLYRNTFPGVKLSINGQGIRVTRPPQERCELFEGTVPRIAPEKRQIPADSRVLRATKKVDEHSWCQIQVEYICENMSAAIPVPIRLPMMI